MRTMKDNSQEVMLHRMDIVLAKGLRKKKYNQSEEHALDFAKKHLRHMYTPIRCTSLAKYFTYVDTSSGGNRTVKGSDMVDILRMTLLPYCRYFTVDKSMKHIATKVIDRLGIECELLNSSDLVALLSA